MKCYKKDALLITKGHYNRAAYETDFDAIKAYQATWSGCSEVANITDYDILRFLYPIVEEFFTEKHYMGMIRERLVKEFEFNRYKGVPTLVDYRFICELFIWQLKMLQIRESQNGAWIIDLSAYENGEHII